MAKRGPAPKTTQKRQRGSKTRVVPIREDQALVVQGSNGDLVPQPPDGLLPELVQVWITYWSSDVARATEDVDHASVQRLFAYYDEWERSMGAVRDSGKRIVQGSTGQPRLSPLLEYVQKLEGMISKLEGELGLTPYARARLGIEIGNAKLTAAELNKLAAGKGTSGEDDEEVEAIDAEIAEGWEAAE